MTTHELSVHEKKEVQGEERTRPGRTYRPDVDIFETPDALVLRADVPGVDEQSLAVRLEDGVLTLEGQVDVKDYENLSPAYTEYNVGNYFRRFTLSRDIDPERIAARATNGVLEVTLPKAERARPRQIKVNAT
jgi:HSP20 family molecular chaperone IbpA